MKGGLSGRRGERGRWSGCVNREIVFKRKPLDLPVLSPSTEKREAARLRDSRERQGYRTVDFGKGRGSAGA